VKASLVLLSLALCGCLARTDLGAEPVGDAGIETLDDAAVDAAAAGPSEETLAAQQFEKSLFGLWGGRVVNFPLDVRLEFEFRPDSSYVSRMDDGPWSDPGYYFVTDRLASGRWAGVMQDAQRNATATFRDMRIERHGGRSVLAFELSAEPSGARIWQIELTKVP